VSLTANDSEQRPIKVQRTGDSISSRLRKELENWRPCPGLLVGRLTAPSLSLVDHSSGDAGIVFRIGGRLTPDLTGMARRTSHRPAPWSTATRSCSALGEDGRREVTVATVGPTSYKNSTTRARAHGASRALEARMLFVGDDARKRALMMLTTVVADRMPDPPEARSVSVTTTAVRSGRRRRADESDGWCARSSTRRRSLHRAARRLAAAVVESDGPRGKVAVVAAARPSAARPTSRQVRGQVYVQLGVRSMPRPASARLADGCADASVCAAVPVAPGSRGRR
jgi:hypothetical protein